MSDHQTLPDNYELLHRGVAEAIEEKHLALRLGRKNPLRVKFGIDPTGYRVHIGHLVPLRKLRAFQEAGHQAVLIIGDYTAQIGDPSGRDRTRSALSLEQTKRFASGYLDQIGRVLDMRRTEVRYNSEWFSTFRPADFLRLMTAVSANNLLAHDTFRKRLDRGQPLGLHEMMYPLLQGYDSVAVKADVELGGNDQKFSLLTGREVQAAYGQEKQDIMLFDYLLGTDGRQKMSKTLANTIDIEDTPKDMYGKVMSIPDKQILSYYELATDASSAKLAEIKRTLRKKTTNPRDLKAELAKIIVTNYYDQPAAEQAEFEFIHVFRKHGAPIDMPTAEIAPGEHDLINLLVSHKLVTSRSEARRLIEQGGVKIDQRPVTDWTKKITAQNNAVLQVGKRRFVRLKLSA